MYISQSEFHLRFLSVLMSMITVSGMILIGIKLEGIATGLIAGLITAILPSEVRYAQDAGQYALIGSFLTFNIISLIYINREGGKTFPYIVWIFTALAGTYNYYGSVIPILVPYSIVAIESVSNREFVKFKWLIILLFIYCLIVSPLVFYFLPAQAYHLNKDLFSTLDFELLINKISNILDSSTKLIAFQYSGAPWSAVPGWIIGIIILILILLIVFKGSPEQRQFLFWFLASWSVFYLIGFFGVIPYSYRYGIILTPLLVPVTALGLVLLLSNVRSWYLGIAFLLMILLISTVSLPNRELREYLYPSNNWSWPETEDLDPVVKYWFEKKNDSDITYVYYGAIPAFVYYLDRYGEYNNHLPPTFWSICMINGTREYCSIDNIHFGQWIRNLTPPLKIVSIFNSIGNPPNEMWIVFAHVFPNEDIKILEELSYHYTVIDEYISKGASVYYLKK